jgi:hypothetical protein
MIHADQAKHEGRYRRHVKAKEHAHYRSLQEWGRCIQPVLSHGFEGRRRRSHRLFQAAHKSKARAASVVPPSPYDRAPIACWRAAEAGPREDSQILTDRRELLECGEAMTDYEDCLILSLPVRARFRGGAARISAPTGNSPRPDKSLIKALANAHQWQKMLLSGEVTSIESLAKRFGLDRGHVGLTLNLAFLSPTITRAIIRGEQPPELRLSRLLREKVPFSWREQEAAFLPNSTANK